MVDIRSHILKHINPCRFVNRITHRLLWCVSGSQGAPSKVSFFYLKRPSLNTVQHQGIVIFTILLSRMDVCETTIQSFAQVA